MRIGTRASKLALWQTELVRDLLRKAGHQTERVEIKTTGDLAPEVPLSRIGARALFTKQIDDALLEERIDLAVHSLKDLPTQLPPGIAIAAISVREDPRDALVGHGPIRWAELPRAAVIATSSLRRKAQILTLRPDLDVADIRGNVDSRLAKLDARPEWAGTVLAAAGLVRLGLSHRIGERLPFEIMLPAPGQGALAVTVREDDLRVAKVVRDAIHNQPSAIRVAAERAFLRELEGGCQVPVAAHAEFETGGTKLRLRGRVISLSGDQAVAGEESTGRISEDAAVQLGATLAHRLLEQGAAVILTDARAAVAPAVPEP